MSVGEVRKQWSASQPANAIVIQFSARLAYNRNGIRYVALGLGLGDESGEITTNPVADAAEGEVEIVSLALKYDINNWRIFFDVNNLTDENSAHKFFGSDGTVLRFDELENVGRSYVLGLSWSME